MADASDDLGIPMKPVHRPAGRRPRPGRRRCRRAPRIWRARAKRFAPRPPRRPGDPAPQPRRGEAEVRKLTVGREITLSGEINSCDQLVDRGQCRGQSDQLPRHRDRRDGLVQGLGGDRGSRDPRPLRGQSDGRKRLLIKASGRVSGRSATARSRSSAAARFPAISRLRRASRGGARSRRTQRPCSRRSNPSVFACGAREAGRLGGGSAESLGLGRSAGACRRSARAGPVLA